MGKNLSILKCNDFKSYGGIFLKIHLLQHITLKVGDALIYQTISTTFTVCLIQLFINSYY